MNSPKRMQQFRRLVYQSFTRRADVSFDLIDALAQAPQVESPVAVSESSQFRRRYASIYDALDNGQVDAGELGRILYAAQPADAETLAGYEVYAADATIEQRPDAETLADRGWQRSNEREPSVPGHKYAWLVRLLYPGRSWAAPLDVRRVPSTSQPYRVAIEQVQELDRRSSRLKVVLADSGYLNAVFLALFLVVKTVVALVRLRSNQVLYKPAVYSGKGRRPKHGPAFRLHEPPPAERAESTTLFGYTVQLRAWYNLHLQSLPALSGTVLYARMLRPDGTPLHQRPLWLFWTGPPAVALADLFALYHWRFVIEHMFRFMKQHLGLTCANVVGLAAVEQWMRLCALAYWQLLLAHDLVSGHLPPWQRQPKPETAQRLTPRQVQRALPSLFAEIGTPARVPQPAGKAPGRAQGFRPQPRPRFPVIRKTNKKPKTPPKRAKTQPAAVP